MHVSIRKVPGGFIIEELTPMGNPSSEMKVFPDWPSVREYLNTLSELSK